MTGLASLLGDSAASAGALVEFPNTSERAPNLLGYLARSDSGLSAELDESRPNGDGPFPAVVVLHGCIGITEHFTGIADRLSSWGMWRLASTASARPALPTVAAVGSRDQPFDAYAALRYLSQLDFVDPARVAVLGESLGGEVALAAVERDLATQYFAERVRAAIVYYPNCVIPAPSMTAPTLILIREADEASPVEQCSEMVAHVRPDGAPITLTVYPGDHYNFDIAQLTPGVRRFGHWLEYNEPAAKDAEDVSARWAARNAHVFSPAVGNRR